ncbi:DUF3368 domain-containing protein [Wenzhouxiangella sp. AB-CW3]|uniref:DUF3368 domain-containing protein n=1 Tax=Wenzhouxiangella sp. AB-CW3 TaxID=2771012 RepID=UPI00168A5D7D|nr:DUF3368 domain-containing protein [Wenzhouxiangella sp. AB-CW3]QOC22226.1 DUF3368 domain-containing protein [Wenzhouxiangella sp. AB-CW3]
MARFVVSDASPLIALGRVGGLPWLKHLFGTVWIPAQVEAEIFPTPSTADQDALRQAVDRGWLKVWPQRVVPRGRLDLDDGERACIELALKHPGTLLLIDERAGRAHARECGLNIAGTAAVIGEARARQVIPSARQVFESLHQSDFRIAPEVIRAVLERVGEL